MKRRALAVFCAATLGLGVLGAAPISTHARSAVLYAATWPAGAHGWSSAGGSWAIKSGVLSYGGGGAAVTVAPYTVSAKNYAVEAVMQLVAWKSTGISESHGYGILLRGKSGVDPSDDTAGLMAGIGKGFVSCNGLTSEAVVATADLDLEPVKFKNPTFRAGAGWHTYRVEVRGNVITISVDGHKVSSVTSSRFGANKRVGLFSLSTAVLVKSFKVIGL